MNGQNTPRSAVTCSLAIGMAEDLDIMEVNCGIFAKCANLLPTRDDINMKAGCKKSGKTRFRGIDRFAWENAFRLLQKTGELFR